MHLEFEPWSGPSDEPPSIRLTDGPPNHLVTVSAETIDADGGRWRSRCVVRTDATGAADLATAVPLSGTYRAADVTGLLWSMEPVDDPPKPFATPWDGVEVTLRAEVDDVTAATDERGNENERADGADAANGDSDTADVASDDSDTAPLAYRYAPTSTTVIRRWSAPGVMRTTLHEPGFVGYLFEPEGMGRTAGVAVVPDPNDVDSAESTAALLASRGYTAMVVGYVGERGLPETLQGVPLESIAEGIRRLAAHPRVDSTRVGVLCTSIGAEGALATLAAFDDLDVRAVVAVSPSSVVWQRTETESTDDAAWTLGGDPIPSLAVHAGRGARIRERLSDVFGGTGTDREVPAHPLEAYETALRDDEAVERAAIRVERIDAPILFVTGDADATWPASEMAAALLQRRSERDYDDALLHFPDTGHRVSLPFVPTTVAASGEVDVEDAEKRARANASAWLRTLTFFARYLGDDESAGDDGLEALRCAGAIG